MTAEASPPKSSHGFDPARWERQIAAGILVIYTLLAVAFSLGPIFEGPDELQHYRMVRFIMTNRDLPTLDRLTGFESNQPPVFYVLVGPVRALFDDSDFAEFARNRNPFYDGYDNVYTGNYNKNLYLHTPAEAFPYTGSPVALTLHVMRLVSVVMGLATMAAGYAIFRELWPDRPDRRLTALGVMAFWPIAVYFAGMVNNDSAVNLMATISLLLVMYQVRRGPSWGLTVLLGAVLGLTLLSKVNAVYLALPIGAAVLTDRRTWPHAVVTVLVMALVSGWWFARNMIVAGEPTGIALFYAQVPVGRVEPGTQTFAHWWPQMVNSYATMWARFGTESIPVSDVLLRLFDLLVIVSILGGLVQAVRSIRARRSLLSLPARQWTVVGLFALCWIVAQAHIIYLNNLTDHGHLLLPGLVGFAACIAAGVDTWTPVALRMRAALSLVLLSLTAVLICLFGFMPLSYQPLDAPEQIAHPLDYRFADAAQLIGTDAPEYRGRPGDTVYITLYWRALRPANHRLAAYVHSLDPGIVKRDSVPGSGNLVANQWQAGQVWAERYPVTIPPDAEPQRVYPLIAGLFDQKNQDRYPGVDANGAETDPSLIGRLVVHGSPQNVQPDYRFGDVIGLKGPAVSHTGSDVKVCFEWISLKRTATDYQVFVHVLDPAGQRITQADVQPRSGQYPTSAWTPGEALDDCVVMTSAQVPASGWHVAAGLYDLETEIRLPVQGPHGEILPDGQVIAQP